jgi:hypothetical protein
MTYLDVYVGSLSDGNDPLDWGGDPQYGNTALRISPFFPPHGNVLDTPHNRLIDQIKQGTYSGKQVDWGAWAARVSKQQILDFIEETYLGDDRYIDSTRMPHLYAWMQELMDCIKSLPNDGYFALVATEL